MLPSTMQWRLKAVCALIIACGLLEMLGIWLIVPFVGYFAGNPEIVVKVEAVLVPLGINDENLAAVVVSGFLGFFVVKNSFLSGALFIQQRFAFLSRGFISSRLFEAYLRRQFLFHTEHHSGVLIRNVVGEVGIITSSALVPSLSLFGEMATLILVLVLTLFIKPELVAIGGLFFGGLSIFFYSVIRSRIQSWGRVRQESDLAIMRQIQEGLGAIKEINLYGVQRKFLDEYFRNACITARMMSNEQTALQLPRFVIELAIVISICCWVLFYGSNEQINKQAVVDFALFAAVGFRLLPSVTRIMSFVQSIRYASPAVETIKQEFADAVREEAAFQKGSQAVAKKNTQLDEITAIEFRNVSFHYPHTTDAQIIKNLDWSIAKGACIGIVGSSGEGKTTIIDLIAGFFEPLSGEIILADEVLDQASQPNKKRIGYVSQSVRILDGSVAENIAFGQLPNEINFDRIRSSIEIAQLTSFVEASPEGLAKQLSEDGRQMSGGEKQRIGIARALYRDCSLLLLDEVTSSLDAESEMAVISALQNLKGRVTIVLVTHRKEPLALCDEVYRLKSGKLEPEKLVKMGL